MKVEQVGDDAFRISGFLQSDAQKSCVVFFNNGIPEVHDRDGLYQDETWCKAWDELAISRVQLHLIANFF